MRFEPEEGTWTQRERVALCSAVGLGSEAMAVPKAPSPGWAPPGRQRSQQPLSQEGAVWSKRVGGWETGLVFSGYSHLSQSLCHLKLLLTEHPSLCPASAQAQPHRLPSQPGLRERL